jgi:hypothetical protein
MPGMPPVQDLRFNDRCHLNGARVIKHMQFLQVSHPFHVTQKLLAVAALTLHRGLCLQYSCSSARLVGETVQATPCATEQNSRSRSRGLVQPKHNRGDF